MQTANQRHLDHRPTVWQLHPPRHGTIVVEGSVWPNFVVISKVTLQNLAQVSFVQYDHPI